jgi:two-component system, NarL family, sensor histidine kinase UhpB
VATALFSRTDVQHTLLRRHLRSQRERIFQHWYQALVCADDQANQRGELSRQLPDLCDQVIAASLAEPFNSDFAEAIGAALAAICVSRPEALGTTLTVLAQELIAGVPDAARDALQLRIAALLGALATGFARQKRAWPSAPPITVTFRPHVDTTDYRILIEHLPAITYIAAFDDTSSTIYTSPQIATLLGFSQAEWMADHTRWLMQIHPDDRERVLDELARIHAGGKPRPCEYRMLTRDGRVIWFLDDAAIMYDNHGQPLYLYGVMSEITERKRIETELADARRRLAESQEAERSRLARELHDEAVQQLLYIGRLIDQRQRSLAEGWTSEAEVVSHAVDLEAIRSEVLAVARQLRTVISELRPAGLDDLGLALALEGYVARLEREGGPDLPQLVLDLHSGGAALPLPIALCLFRVAQEALRNAIRHAQAQQVTLHLRITPEQALLAVQDDGCGFRAPVELSIFALADHVGLIGIAERVAGVSGTLEIVTQPGAGTTVRVCVPLESNEKSDG